MPQLQEHGFLETDQSNNEVCNLKYENTRKTNYFYRIEFQARGKLDGIKKDAVLFQVPICRYRFPRLPMARTKLVFAFLKCL
jgi:hypothetical protein